MLQMDDRQRFVMDLKDREWRRSRREGTVARRGTLDDLIDQVIEATEAHLEAASKEKHG
jgi:hypothetical protein